MCIVPIVMNYDCGESPPHISPNISWAAAKGAQSRHRCKGEGNQEILLQILTKPA